MAAWEEDAEDRIETASHMHTLSHNHRIFFARNLRCGPAFLNVTIVVDKEINQSLRWENSRME